MTAPGAAEERIAVSPVLLHDLRTPLGQIIGYAELLAERAEEAGDERFLPDLRKVSAAGYRMLALLEQSFTALPTPGASGPDPRFTRDDVELLSAHATGDDSARLADLAARIAALLPPRA